MVDKTDVASMATDIITSRLAGEGDTYLGAVLLESKKDILRIGTNLTDECDPELFGEVFAMLHVQLLVIEHLAHRVQSLEALNSPIG